MFVYKVDCRKLAQKLNDFPMVGLGNCSSY